MPDLRSENRAENQNFETCKAENPLMKFIESWSQIIFSDWSLFPSLHPAPNRIWRSPEKNSIVLDALMNSQTRPCSAEISISLAIYSIFAEQYSEKVWEDVFHRESPSGLIGSKSRCLYNIHFDSRAAERLKNLVSNGQKEFTFLFKVSGWLLRTAKWSSLFPARNEGDEIQRRNDNLR
jgi:hypothetical protein